MTDPADTVPSGVRRLFSPLRIGRFEVANRIVATTHGSGLPPARDIRYLQERARGGAGLIGIHSGGGTYGYAVGPGPRHETPSWDSNGPSPLSDEWMEYFDRVAIPGMAARAEVIHAEGARCFAQVYHSGAARHAVASAPVVAPSSIPDPYEAHTPHALTAREIDELVWCFAHDIRRAEAAGVDAVEIHGAHGYLVHQFLSPYANRRTDRWGGSTLARVRFVRDVIDAARTLVDRDYPIGIRLGLDGDGVRRGLTIEQLAETAGSLSDAVAFVSVSSGSYAGVGDGLEGAYVSPWYREPGFNADAAAAVKAVVDVPVIVTGRIADVALAEAMLADGVADLIGMVRALIADPHLPNKARAGRSDEIRGCLGMSECHAIGAHRVPLTCAVNAEAAREDELVIVPARVPRTVVVVGAGPAGMEAARVAAMRGHHVVLADERRSIGGTPAVLAVDPNRRNLRDHAVWFDGELRRLGIELVLGNRVTADELVAFGAEVVVVATGGVPVVPEVPGIDGPNVVQALDILRGAPVGERVLVVGGFEKHLGAPTIAEHLADRGAAVELVSEQFDFFTGIEDGTRFQLRARLAEKGVTVSLTHRLVRVEDGGAVVLDAFTRVERFLASTTVVLACGLVPDDGLATELEGRVPEIHLIGDALAPRRMMHATLDGARIGRAV